MLKKGKTFYAHVFYIKYTRKYILCARQLTLNFKHTHLYYIYKRMLYTRHYILNTRNIFETQNKKNVCSSLII